MKGEERRKEKTAAKEKEKEKEREKEKEKESVKTSATNMLEVEGEIHGLKALRRCIS